MTRELQEAVHSLREISPKLNAAATQTTEVVNAVESFLNDECQIGIPGAVRLFENGDRRENLEYTRVGGKLRIAIHKLKPRYEEDGDGGYERFSTADDGDAAWETESLTPWSECSRIDRMMTFHRLPDLLKGIATDSKTILDVVENTSKTVSEILNALRK